MVDLVPNTRFTKPNGSWHFDRSRSLLADRQAYQGIPTPSRLHRCPIFATKRHERWSSIWVFTTRVENGQIWSDSGRIRQLQDHLWVAHHRMNPPVPTVAGETQCTAANLEKKQTVVAAKPDPRPSDPFRWKPPPRTDSPPSDLQSPMANLAWNVAWSNEFQETSIEFKI